MRLQVPDIQSAAGKTAVEQRALHSNRQHRITAVLELSHLHRCTIRSLSYTPQFDGSIPRTCQQHLFRGRRFNKTTDKEHGVHISMVGKQLVLVAPEG